jgi:hypothetical protein
MRLLAVVNTFHLLELRSKYPNKYFIIILTAGSHLKYFIHNEYTHDLIKVCFLRTTMNKPQ